VVAVQVKKKRGPVFSINGVMYAIAGRMDFAEFLS